MSLVGVGVYFLQSILGVEDEVKHLGPSEQQEILQNMDRGDEVYIHANTVNVRDGRARVPVAIRNRFDDKLQPVFEVECITCGGDELDFITTGRNISPQEEAVILGWIRNETWSPGQYTMLVNVTNKSSDTHIGAETVVVQR